MTDHTTDTRHVRDEAAVDQLFESLTDEESRAILRETRTEALTAKELSQRCGIATSTAYRKLEQLVDIGLLEEGVRLTGKTRHAREYTHDIDGIELDVTATGISIVVSEAVTEQPDQPVSAD